MIHIAEPILLKSHHSSELCSLDAALSGSNTVIPGVIKAVRDLDLTLFFISFFFVLVILLSTYFVVRSVWLDSGIALGLVKVSIFD